MPLTHDFYRTMRARAPRDQRFRAALLEEGPGLLAEIQRRSAAFDAGLMASIPGDTVFREIREDLVGRYKSQSPQAEFEPGSRKRVLRNLLGIRSAREMARHESAALVSVTDRLASSITTDHRFTPDDMCRIHSAWLGEIYPWAGEYRGVNVAKGDFLFAAAGQIPALMAEYGTGPLREFTPCRFAQLHEQAFALAVTHAELVLIHPFREGNGRCARLLATLMGFQAGLPPLDFSPMRSRQKRRYINAIHAALGHDYMPMTRLFEAVIRRTVRS